MRIAEALYHSKYTSGDIPIKIMKMAKERICPYLTDCINAAIYNCSFLDGVKKADISAIFKRGIQAGRAIADRLVFWQQCPKYMNEIWERK